MAEWYASGGAVLAVLGLMGVEACVLLGVWWRWGQGIAPGQVAAGIGAGACLVSAAGVALRGGWWGWVGALLLAGGALHLVDLRLRWRRSGGIQP